MTGHSGIWVGYASYDVVLEDVTITALESSGVSVSYDSHDIVLKNVTIDAAYSGVGLSWDSWGLTMTDSVIRGGHAALDFGMGTSDARVERSELEGGFTTVGLAGGTNVHLLNGRLIGGENGIIELNGIFGASDIQIIGNRVQGSLPPSDPERRIEIRDNIPE
jgi:hypothetical protein